MPTQVAPKFVHKPLDVIADELASYATRLAKLSAVARNGCAFLQTATSGRATLAGLVVAQVTAMGNELADFSAMAEED